MVRLVGIFDNGVENPLPAWAGFTAQLWNVDDKCECSAIASSRLPTINIQLLIIK